MTTDLYPIPLDAALMYAALDLRSAPVGVESKVPSITEWPTRATTDPAIINSWYNDLRHANDGVCLVAGRGSGFFVVDVDVANGKPGLASLRSHIADNGGQRLPESWVARTPSGGYHYYYCYPKTGDVFNSGSRNLGPGLDVRGEGGQVNAPPTTRAAGSYSWVEGRAPWDVDLADAPPWLLDLVIDKPVQPKPQVPRPAQSATAIASAKAFGLDHEYVGRITEATNWDDELSHPRADFTFSHDTPGQHHWTRPGKATKDGSSVTVYDDSDCITVWTTSVPWLEVGRTYDRYGFIVMRDHDGDFKRAAQYFGHNPTPPPQIVPAPPSPDDLDLLSPPDKPELDAIDALTIDWATFWDIDLTEDDWLIEPLIARARGHALFAKAKDGKSYIVLQAVAGACSGRRNWAVTPAEPVTVLYFDYEMTKADLRERLDDIGYTSDDELGTLHYVNSAGLGADLDTPAGGHRLLAKAVQIGADLVIIDTMSRAVSGDENDADTVRDFYRCTGSPLKAAGIAVLRLDHAGKEMERGQRGTSAKADDVDIVWGLSRTEDGALLTLTHSRMAWVPAKVPLTYVGGEDGFQGGRHERAEASASWPVGLNDMVERLVKAGVPTDFGWRRAKNMGVTGSPNVISKAQEWRRRDVETLL